MATRTIAAPLDAVFQAVSDVRNFAKAVPHITNIDFLTGQKRGAGTRFRETRLMKGREHTTELEVAEYVENDRVRMIADAGGTVWDTVFTVVECNGTIELSMRMDAKPHNILARVTIPLIRGMVARAVEDDMDSVKAWCEADSANTVA